MTSPTQRNPITGRRPARPIREKTTDWLIAHGRLGVAFVDHSEIDGFDFGLPLIDAEARECLSAQMRKRLASVVAVERTVYTGLRSAYTIRRSHDLAALLAGLAYGFTPATLRLERKSLQRCVDGDAWRLSGCEYWESRGGSWRRPPNPLRAALDGKNDTRSKWTAQLFTPTEPLFGGFAPYLLTLVAGMRTKAGRSSALEIKIDSASQARDVAADVALALGVQIPPRERKSTRAISPALVWTDGTPAGKTTLTRKQWACAS